jgi:hypothetical protein
MQNQQSAVASMAKRVANLKANGFNVNNVKHTKAVNSKQAVIQNAIQAKATAIAPMLLQHNGPVYMVGAISSAIVNGSPVKYAFSTQTAHRGYFKRVQNALKACGVTAINPACPKAFRVAIGLSKTYKPSLNCQNAFNAASNKYGMQKAISKLQNTNKQHATVCGCVLVIMPNKSFNSAGVQQELMWASNNNKPIYVF